VPVPAPDIPAEVAEEVNCKPVSFAVSARVTTPAVTVTVDENVAAFAIVTVFEPVPITTALAPLAARVSVVDVPVIVVAVSVGIAALANTAAPAADTYHVLEVPLISFPEPPLVI